MRNIFLVTQFEVIRSIKKLSFWLMAIIIPIFLIAYIFAAALVGYNTEESLSSGTKTVDLRLGIYDAPQYLEIYSFENERKEVQNLQQFDSEEQGIEAVKNRELDVLYVIPDNFVDSHKVSIYTKPDHNSLFDDYSHPISTLLDATAKSHVDQTDYNVIKKDLNYTPVVLDADDDHVVDQSERISEVIAPAIGLGVFYILIVVFSNRLTVSMVEEKENRISELILTSVTPRQLIAGKILSLLILCLIQLTVLVVPFLVIYFYAITNADIPAEYRNISLDPISLLQSLTLVVASYFFVVACCVLISSLVPTAKDASSFSAVIFIPVLAPIFFISLFASKTPILLVDILCICPFTAPVSLFLRQLFGHLPLTTYYIGLSTLIISSIIIIYYAAKIFHRNALNTSRKLDLKKLLSERRETWQ